MPESDDPQRGGYIKWYFENDLVYSILGRSLSDKVKGSRIPSEPQYVILSTAMSSTWGFPHPCPKGCDCTCWSCSEPEGKWGRCGCAMPPGFCENLPATFKLDFVRVYQYANDTHQKVSTFDLIYCAHSDPRVDVYEEDQRKC